MSRISFLNGYFINHDQAMIHIEDRGMQFADGIYEVILFHNNRLIDNQWHLERLFRSLNEISIQLPYSHEQITTACLDLFKQNILVNGSVYLQITRGNATRNQLIPKGITPTVIMTVSSVKHFTENELDAGISAITMEDIRWQRCDIKSIGLLASSLCKQKAADLGYAEAIFVRKDKITECTFSNLFIVDSIDNLITKPLDNFILSGITRRRVIELAKQLNIKIIEEEIDTTQLLAAKEVFSTSTTLLIRPITSVNGQLIGNGKCGKITWQLIHAYQNFLNILED